VPLYLSMAADRCKLLCHAVICLTMTYVEQSLWTVPSRPSLFEGNISKFTTLDRILRPSNAPQVVNNHEIYY
jgi:hypothetical protein